MRIVHAGPDLASIAAQALIRSVTHRLRDRPRVSLAVSGGRTPGPVFAQLAEAAIDWQRVDVYQVDERIAPAGDPARNLTGLRTALLSKVPATLFAMPVEAVDLEAAAHAYASSLPEVLDVVHLGLGDDGHTASLVPGDPVLEVTDRRVAITAPYRGHRRMTLTLPALASVHSIVWIVGSGKAAMIERLLAADPTIPAGRIPQDRAVLVHA